jgi:hypothetical protein
MDSHHQALFHRTIAFVFMTLRMEQRTEGGWSVSAGLPKEIERFSI